jgi:chorismate mutase/prephenate dehydratase
LNIPEHRKAIDQLDAQIVRLLNERTRHVLEIGGIKLKAGEEIYAPHRELAVLQRVCRLNEGPITDLSLRAIYREIMSSALSLEKSMTIAYLGPEATYTHQAAVRRFGSSLRYSPQKTIAEVFLQVSQDRADYGVVPVENATEGMVTNTLDMFVESDLKIVAQILMPIRHCLVSRGKREQIKRLFCHPLSLEECRGWVQNHLPQAKIIETASPHQAAEEASKEPGAAAIANELAAERNSLRILAHGIQDNAAGDGRFLILGRKCSPPTGDDRTSLMLSIDDRVGSLDQVLALLKKRRLNLTNIESRPNQARPAECLMFIDVDGHEQEPRVARAIDALGKKCRLVKVLGSYSRFDWGAARTNP